MTLPPASAPDAPPTASADAGQRPRGRSVGTAGGPSGVTQASLREHNLATIARCVFAAPSPVSRADVAAVTGITRATVSRLVDQLVHLGVLMEDDPSRTGVRGRPSIPLRPAERTHFGLGMELNVGHVAVTAIDLAGTVLGQVRIDRDFRDSDPAEALASVVPTVHEVLAAAAPARLVTTHLALPGIVDHETGTLLRAPNLAWSDVDPRRILQDAGMEGLDHGLTVGNEADFAALGTLLDAPGRPGPLDSFLYISGDVGIGSASVLRGQVLTGRHGWGGEIGHMCVDPEGAPCGCGATGCLETVAGRQAILDAAGVDDWTEVQRVAHGPDPMANPALARAAHALGIAFSGALNLIDQTTIVMGGHLGSLGQALTPVIDAELERRVLAAPLEAPRLISIDGPDDAASVGAACAGIERLLDAPARLDPDH